MADKQPRRVLRAYSLPVELFDHIQAVKRQRQSDIDRRTGTVAREGDAEWVSTSAALSGIVYAHSLLASAAERDGMSVDQLVDALAIHGFKVAIPRGVVEVGA